jgi:ketosteroid isomerase-like protein
MTTIHVLAVRTIRAAGLLVRDRRIPRPVRWVLGLSLLPIPGPFDEALLLIVAPPIFLLYREPMRDAWREGRRPALGASVSDELDRARQGVEAFNRGDLEGGLGELHPEAEWVVAREHPAAATHRGREAILAYLRDWRETMEDLRLEPDELEQVGDRVLLVGQIRGRGRDSALDLDVPIALVSTYRDGVPVRAEEYLDPAEARREVGLEHPSI